MFVNTPIIIQARSGSKRWPGKVLQGLGYYLDGDKGKEVTVLDLVIHQCCLTFYPVVVAVPEGDKPVLDLLKRNILTHSYDVVEGHPDDLIRRYLKAADRTGCKGFLRVTADCPFIIPSEIVYQRWMSLVFKADFVSNGFPDGRSVPDGFDCEYYSVKFLRWLDSVATGDEREHLPLYVYQHLNETREKWAIVGTHWPLDMSNIKVSLDKKEDLEALIQRGWYW